MGELDGVVLARVASRNPETARLVGPVVMEDWREMVRAPDLDGVIIATPPRLHAEMTTAAVAAGLAVLVEKPLTLDLEEAWRLREFVRRANGRVLVDHTHLFNPAYEALRDRARVLGPIRAVRAVAGNSGPFRPDVPVLWDWGPHDVSLCLDLLSEKPLEVSAAVERLQAGGHLGERVAIALRFASGVLAELTFANVFEGRRRLFEVTFDAETLIFDDMDEHKLRRVPRAGAGALGTGEPIAVDPEPPLARVVRHFVSDIARGAADAGSLDLAVDVVEVLSRCEAAMPQRAER